MHNTIPDTPLLTSVKAACRILNVGRTYLYTALIKTGQLETVKLGRRTLIKVASIEALISQNEVAR